MAVFPPKSRFVGPCPNCQYDRYKHALSLHKEGYTIYDIANIMGVGVERVRNSYLGHIPPHELHIIKKNAKRHPKADEIEDLYLKGLTKRQIVDKLGVPTSVVQNSTYGLKPFEYQQRNPSLSRRSIMADEKEYLIGEPDVAAITKRGPGRPPGSGNAAKAASPARAEALTVERGKRISKDVDDDDEDDEEEEASMLRIDKDVPMPNDTYYQTRGVGSAIPFSEMEVGDSVLVPAGFMGIKDIKVLLSRCRNTVSNQKKKHGKRYLCKPTNKGIRIWRAE